MLFHNDCIRNRQYQLHNHHPQLPRQCRSDARTGNRPYDVMEPTAGIRQVDVFFPNACRAFGTVLRTCDFHSGILEGQLIFKSKGQEVRSKETVDGSSGVQTILQFPSTVSFVVFTSAGSSPSEGIRGGLLNSRTPCLQPPYCCTPTLQSAQNVSFFCKKSIKYYFPINGK